MKTETKITEQVFDEIHKFHYKLNKETNTDTVFDVDCIRKAISRAVELMEEDFQEGYIKGTKRILNDKHNAYDIGVGDAKADFRKMIEEELKECKIHLKKNLLNNYWLGREIVLEKLLAKLGDDSENKK